MPPAYAKNPTRSILNREIREKEFQPDSRNWNGLQKAQKAQNKRWLGLAA
jgi:hypothetical protein